MRVSRKAITLFILSLFVFSSANIQLIAASKEPYFSDVGFDLTVIGQPCVFSTFWYARTGNLSHYVFGSNNTGTWVNNSEAAFSSGQTSAWSNVTVAELNYTEAGTVVEFTFWVNDTSDNWANTSSQYLTTTIPDRITELEWLFNQSVNRIVNSSFPFVRLWNEDTQAFYDNAEAKEMLYGIDFYMQTGNKTFLEYTYKTANYLLNTMPNRDTQILIPVYDVVAKTWFDEDTSQAVGTHLIVLSRLAEFNSTYKPLIVDAADRAIIVFLNATSNAYRPYYKAKLDGTVSDSKVFTHHAAKFAEGLAYAGNVTGNSSYTDAAVRICMNISKSAVNLPFVWSTQTGTDASAGAHLKEDQHFGQYLLSMEAVYYFTRNLTVKNLIYDAAWAGAQYFWHDTFKRFIYRINFNTGAHVDTIAVHGFGMIDEAIFNAYLIWGNTTWRDRARADFDELAITATVGNNLLRRNLIIHSTSGADLTVQLYWNIPAIRFSIILFKFFDNVTYLQAYNRLYAAHSYCHKKVKGYADAVESDDITDVSAAPFDTRFDTLFRIVRNTVETIESFDDVYAALGESTSGVGFDILHINATLPDLKAGEWIIVGSDATFQIDINTTLLRNLVGVRLTFDIMEIEYGSVYLGFYYNHAFESWSTLYNGSGFAILDMERSEVRALTSTHFRVKFVAVLSDAFLDQDGIGFNISYVVSDKQFDKSEGLPTFNIYRIGGLTNLTVSGAGAGIITGGDWINVYASSAATTSENYITFHKLQHVHLLLGLYMGNDTEMTSDAQGYFQFYLSSYYDGAWSDDFGMQIIKTDSNIDGTHNWVELQVQFVQRQNGAFTVIKTEFIYASYEGHQNREAEITRFWIDLWYNEQNNSETGGARITSFYQAEEKGGWFPAWGDWGPMGNLSMAECYFDVNKPTVISSSKIEMMRFKVKAGQNGVKHEIQKAFEQQYTIAKSHMMGIPTPTYIDSQPLAEGTGGFFAGLWAAIMGIGKALGEVVGWIWDTVMFPALQGLWTGIAELWKGFVAVMDSIFAFFGMENAFTNFLNWIQSLGQWVFNGFTWLIAALTPIFSFFAVTMGKLTNTLGNVLTQWVLMLQTFFDFLGGVYTSGINLWVDLRLDLWITLGAILYPMFLLAMWETKGIDAVIGHLRMIIDIISFVVNIFISVIQLFISVIGRIIETIPVVE